MIMYLTLQEEKDSGLNEVGIGTLSASPFRGTFIFRFSVAEQSLRIFFISWESHGILTQTADILFLGTVNKNYYKPEARNLNLCLTYFLKRNSPAATATGLCAEYTK